MPNACCDSRTCPNQRENTTMDDRAIHEARPLPHRMLVDIHHLLINIGPSYVSEQIREVHQLLVNEFSSRNLPSVALAGAVCHLLHPDRRRGPRGPRRGCWCRGAGQLHALHRGCWRQERCRRYRRHSVRAPRGIWPALRRRRRRRRTQTALRE